MKKKPVKNTQKNSLQITLYYNTLDVCFNKEDKKLDLRINY